MFTKLHILTLTAALRGRKFNAVAKRNMSLARKNEWKNLKRRKIGFLLLDKIRRLPRKMKEETKLKISRSNFGKKLSKIHRMKISKSLIGKPKSKDHRMKLSLANKGKVVSKHIREKIRLSMIDRWKDKEYAERVYRNRIKGFGKPNNKSERLFFKVIDNCCKGEYKPNFRGQIINIGGKFPDFININGQKKCIEYAGSYWHESSYERKRIAHLKKFGWKCLVIWDYEMKNLKKVIIKIKEFNSCV